VFFISETRGYGMAPFPKWQSIQEILKRCMKHRKLTVHQHNDLALRLLRRHGGNHYTVARVLLQGFGYAYADEHDGISCTVDEYEASQMARVSFWKWRDKVAKSKHNPFSDVWDEQNAAIIMLKEAKCVVENPNMERRRLQYESAKDDGRTVRSLSQHYGRSNQRGCPDGRGASSVECSNADR
jgi:hypothetical protein